MGEAAFCIEWDVPLPQGPMFLLRESPGLVLPGGVKAKLSVKTDPCTVNLTLVDKAFVRCKITVDNKSADLEKHFEKGQQQRILARHPRKVTLQVFEVALASGGVTRRFRVP